MSLLLTLVGGGGTSVNATPAAGELTVTGYAPTVQLPINVLAGVGAMTVTGYAPTVQTPVVILPGVGLLVMTGYAPTVTAGSLTPVEVFPLAGELIIVGFTPLVSVVPVPSVGGGGTGIDRKRKKKGDLLVNTNHDELWAVADALTPSAPRAQSRPLVGVGAATTSNTVNGLTPQLAAIFAIALDQLDE